MRPRGLQIETSQTQVWQCGEEVTFAGAGDPRASGEKVLRARVVFCYTEL